MPTRRLRPARIARFSDFELDLRAGELRRDGVRVKLQEQPFRILAMLLEHPGEVVLRDDIRKRLWPNDTVVEVSHGINAAILRLREALGESAESPRFIETLPRRGYRFNGQVEWESGPPLTVTAATSTQFPITGAVGWDGRTVSHYRVFHKLGRGGMGVVYRAEDLQLGRHVALKFLAPEFAQDPEARDRFQREARAASALNHPNVCTVYSVEECAGQPFISMELVVGETLSAILARGPFPVSQSIGLAIQVAAALEAAHRKGVVHRDLKPGNLMVTDCGVKVLDFGIAKMERPTVREAATEEGDVMGTPQYMSPEQVQGRVTDARSDIYSFGLVLREMLAGSRVPPRLDGLISRCLAEDPEARWESASELKAELERIAAPELLPEPVNPPVPARNLRDWRWAPVAALALLTTGILIAKLPLHRAPAPPVRFTLTGPVEARATSLKLSPDGRSLAFVSGTEHYLRTFDRNVAQLLFMPAGPGVPFWAPDGRSIAAAAGGQLVRVGTGPNSLANSLARISTNLDGAWGLDDTILIGQVNDGIYRIPASGGMLTRVTVPDSERGETRHLLPQFLPGGRRFLYVAGSNRPGNSFLWEASLDSPDRTAVMPMQSNFVFVPSKPGDPKGRLVYLRDRVLVAQEFDSVKLRPLGEPYPLAPSVASNTAIGTLVSTGDFSVTPAALAYRVGNVITVIQNWMNGPPPAPPLT